MKRILLGNPAISTTNLGDQIIGESAKQQINSLISDSFVTEISTHLPISYYYGRNLRSYDLKFILGSNLLKSTFFGFKRQWDITITKGLFLGPFVLVGAGWWQYNNEPNLYTKALYRGVLSKEMYHSVRDDFTKARLESIGIKNVVNTGCPTLWGLSEEHCADIPTKKQENVVVTLTDYNKSPAHDRDLILTLRRLYNKVYFWPQGLGDYHYLESLGLGGVDIIEPSVQCFDKLLSAGEIDYVGTRLHAGIRALQKKARSIIIAVDNRAIEKQKDFNLPVVKRGDLEALNLALTGELRLELSLPWDVISFWKSQFE